MRLSQKLLLLGKEFFCSTCVPENSLSNWFSFISKWHDFGAILNHDKIYLALFLSKNLDVSYLKRDKLVNSIKHFWEGAVNVLALCRALFSFRFFRLLFYINLALLSAIEITKVFNCREAHYFLPVCPLNWDWVLNL